MKYKMSILIASFLSLQAMDAPPVQTETVPVKMQDFHNKEQRKFKKYDLEHPETFIQLMREKFNYEKSKEEYLRQVQELLSGLLGQHLAMDYFGQNVFFGNHYFQLEDTSNIFLRRTNSQGFGFGIATMLNPETTEQLNIILAHSDLLKKQDLYSSEELSTIYRWILDTQKGPWLNNLGLLLKTREEGRIEAAKANAIRPKAESSIRKLADSPFETDNSLAPDNFLYAENILELSRTALSKNNPSVFRTFNQLTADLAQLYRIHQKEYQLLYTIVKNELFTQYRQAVLAGLKIPPAILFPIPEQLRKQNHIPSKFPDQLETIKNPATYLTHASLDEELEKARIEWNKAQKTKPKIKKKIRRKKYLPLETTSFESGSAEAITIAKPEEIKKIKIGVDGSYIEEGTEDDLKIVIEDPIHDTTATIFKTKNSPENSAQIKALPKINYTRWVNEWFENPENAIITQGYKDPKNPRFRAGEPAWMPIVLHAFPKLIDDYIYHYGSVSQTPSRTVKAKNDIMVTIPGKMEYPDGNEETGVFTYIIDPDNGQWFHRMFTPSSHKKMAADFMGKGYFSPEIKGYYDVYFPPLVPKVKPTLP
jgi:hypothetical protein